MAKDTIKQNVQMFSSVKERDKQEFRYVQEALHMDGSRKQDQNKVGKFSHVTVLQ